MEQEKKLILGCLYSFKENRAEIKAVDVAFKEHSNMLFINGINYDLSQGICDTVVRYIHYFTYTHKILEIEDNLVDTVYELLKELFPQWEHYSGNFLFPIKVEESDFEVYLNHPKWSKVIKRDHSAKARSFRIESELYNFIGYNDLNQWVGAYGERRWQLVDYLIGVLEK